MATWYDHAQISLAKNSPVSPMLQVLATSVETSPDSVIRRYQDNVILNKAYLICCNCLTAKYNCKR